MSAWIPVLAISCFSVSSSSVWSNMFDAVVTDGEVGKGGGGGGVWLRRETSSSLLIEEELLSVVKFDWVLVDVE